MAFGPLLPGDHLFRVRETLGGLTGPAASYRWTIDLPRACVRRVARVRVFVFARQHRVRLVIHYKNYRPAEVTVSSRLAGSKGSLALGSASSRFATAGVFRLPEHLESGATAKVRATRSMKVHFKISKTPQSCGRRCGNRRWRPAWPVPPGPRRESERSSRCRIRHAELPVLVVAPLDGVIGK